jgi:type II secretory pathway component GspD/PulD (secretin)
LGLTFAASLQSALSENKASVFADTTLHGVSGEKISFSNTNTYRYRDNNLDPETGKPVYTGVTREIASGLTLDITGTVSGDGMITSKVTASVSRRGADVSAATGNPPPTSEKSITTEVRSRSGEPVILSGLVQNDETMVAERTPFISRIPLLGKLFSADTKTKEHTEMIIYLLPNTENGPASDTGRLELPEERSHRVYRTVILGEKQ